MDARSVLTPARRGASRVAPTTMKSNSLADDSVGAEKPSGSTDPQQAAICSSLLSRSREDPGLRQACGLPKAAGPSSQARRHHGAGPRSGVGPFGSSKLCARLQSATAPRGHPAGISPPRSGQRWMAVPPPLSSPPRPRPRRALGPATPRGASAASARRPRASTRSRPAAGYRRQNPAGGSPRPPRAPPAVERGGHAPSRSGESCWP